MSEKWMQSHQNFERRVLGCIDSYDSNQIVMLQHFSRSARFTFLRTAPYSKFAHCFVFQFFVNCRNFAIFEILLKFVIFVLIQILMKISRNFTKIFRIHQNLQRFAENHEFMKFWQDFVNFEILVQMLACCRSNFGGRGISAESTPILATKYSFCRFFRDLQGLHSFAPLHIQNFNEISSISRWFFGNFSREFF